MRNECQCRVDIRSNPRSSRPRPRIPTFCNLEETKKSAGNRGGKYSADVAGLPRRGFENRSRRGAAPVRAYRSRGPSGIAPGWAGCRLENLRSSRLRIPTSRWNSDWWICARVDAWRQFNGHQRADVPHYLPKAKFSLFRGNEIFQPFALATPLYPINFRLIGGVALGCAQ
jgi:hypothetical protein